MFWRTKRKKNVRPQRRAKLLRLESLESRQMLSGVVQVQTYPLIGAGFLNLVGDNSVHSVKITSTPGGALDAYTITSKDGDLFQLNGAGATLTSLSVNGIVNDISVSLGQGGPNTFDFEAPAATPGSASTVLANLIINNQSVETNIINNVLIQGDLSIYSDSFGYKELDMLGTQVNGYTNVNNYASGGRDAPGPGRSLFSGDSMTNITNCTFEGLNVKPGENAGNTESDDVVTDPIPALQISNGVGNNVVLIQSASPLPANETTGLTRTQIGFQTVTANDAFEVTNNLGEIKGVTFGNGSNTTLTNGGNAPSPVVYGAVEIENGETFPLQSNQVNFVGTVVYGAVDVVNDPALPGGNTRTSVQNSILGAQLNNNAPVDVVNVGIGSNQFLMTASQIPWGLAIVNASSSYGNSTIIDSSFIGQTASGASPQVPVVFDVSGPQSGDRLFIQGSTDGVGGPDTVVIRNNTVVNGGVDLQLGSGDKNVALDSSRMSCFYMVQPAGSAGNDQLWIGGTTITNLVFIRLATGNDTIWLQKGNTNLAPDSLPDALSGSVDVQWAGAAGVSNLIYDVSDATQAFPFFLPDTTATVATASIPAWALVPSV